VEGNPWRHLAAFVILQTGAGAHLMEEDCGTVNESPLIPQETVFKAYNGSVHKWVTFNEPVVFCSQASFRAAIL
jgi:hypothetical protein